MVNFFLNMDVSGSAHTDPLLPIFRPEVLAVNITSINKVKVILGGSKNAKGGVHLSNTKIVVKVGENTFISNILGTDPYNNDNANFVELDYTFAANHFNATNFASEIHFIIDGITDNELDAALMNIGLPHEHALAANNDYVAGALPSTSTPNFSSAKIIDRNNWRIEIGNPETLGTPAAISWQYIKVELSRTSLGVTTSTTLFDGANGSVDAATGILEGELSGSVGYFLHGDVLHLTHSENDEHTLNTFKITTTTTTSPFQSPKFAIDPDQTKILAQVNVEESVFANVFKFRFENQPPKPYFSSLANSNGVFSLTNTDSSMTFWYERDISGSDNTIFIPSLETDKFDDADDWSWQKYVSASETGSNYQPWVHDGNLIADKIFGTQVKNITSDIFKNEDTLISNIKAGYNSVIDVIEDSLKGKTIKVAQGQTTADIDIFNKHKRGGGYDINESDHILKENEDIFENVDSDFIVNSKNIPQFLLEQILRENPNRLTDINFTDTQNKQSIPLKAGDVLIIENKLKITYKDPFTKGSVTDHVNNETVNGSYNKYMVINIVANST